MASSVQELQSSKQAVKEPGLEYCATKVEEERIDEKRSADESFDG